MKLSAEFYQRGKVVQIARELLGKILVTHVDGLICKARITETEAYAGVTDKASHAWGGRFTPRTQIMYEAGGTAYVYLCYGIHHLFNVVTHEKGIPHAVLIRGAEPLQGVETMLKRRNKLKLDYSLTSGPGALSEAMGIKTTHSGLWLMGETIYLLDNGFKVPERMVIASPRVGVAYAKEDAFLPYRFRIKDSLWTSKAK